MKKRFSVVLIAMMLLTSFDAKAVVWAHEPFFDLAVFDIGGAISRGLQALIKFFLGDDERIRQARYIHLGIVGQDFSRNQGHQTIIVGAFHLRLRDAQFTSVFHTTELFLHTFRQISQHILDKQSVGIQA